MIRYWGGLEATIIQSTEEASVEVLGQLTFMRKTALVTAKWDEMMLADVNALPAGWSGKGRRVAATIFFGHRLGT